MKSRLREELRKEKKNKKVAFAELEERFHTKDAAKRNIKRFKDADVDDEDSDGEPYTEFQQELLGDYVEVEESIADAQLQLESIKKRRRHTFRAIQISSFHFSFLISVTIRLI